MQIYKTGRFYDFEQVLEIIRVEGGYNFRDLSRCGIAGHIEANEKTYWHGYVRANYDCTSGAILGAAILGHYDRGEYEQISQATFENSKDLDVYSIDFAGVA